MSLLCGGPIWNLKTLEESSWSSVEVNISNSFEEGIWVEILSINMELNVWLFVELIAIEVFNSNTYIIIKLKINWRLKGKKIGLEVLPISLDFSTWKR